MSKNDTYFAALEAEKTASILLDRAKSFYNLLESNNYLDKLKNMWQAYHGNYTSYTDGHRIEFGGEQGELVQLPVNHFRNLAQHILVMVTSNRPIMEARSVNTDYKSLAQTYLANGILDYYMREKHLEDALKKAAEIAIVLGAGFIKLEWNATAGEIFDADEETGEFNYEGEIEFSTYTPFDVVVDGSKENWDHDWVVVRSFENRFNLIAKYPELADKLKTVPSKTESSVSRLSVWSNDETDDIPIYEFFHKRSEAMPDGRYLLFVDSDIVLLDAPLPYRVLPVFRITPGDILGTPYGYTPMFDVYPIQEALNSMYSAILTNQNAFAVQNVFVPKGSDLSISSIEGGMNIVEGNSKPEPLNLTETPAEIFKFIEVLVQSAETLSGVSSVTRGSPEASLRSGSALALVQSMALQFISGLQNSYVKMIEDCGTALIQILKDFAMTPKVIALVGKNNRTFLKEFTGEDVSSINRVIVDVGNPLSRSIAGRVQMAEQMLQMGVVKSPQQYFQVLNTGRLDSMFEGEMTEMLLIKSENEKLVDGETVKANALDQHKLHIMEHKSVLADPDLRKDADLVTRTLQHIQQHIDLLRTVDPDLLMLIGEQPLQNPNVQQQPPAPGQPQVPGQPMPPNSSMPGIAPEMMSPMQGLTAPGQAMTGPGVQNVALPNVPTPPAPFETLPVSPGQMVPPIRG